MKLLLVIWVLLKLSYRIWINKNGMSSFVFTGNYKSTKLRINQFSAFIIYSEVQIKCKNISKDKLIKRLVLKVLNLRCLWDTMNVCSLKSQICGFFYYQLFIFCSYFFEYKAWSAILKISSRVLSLLSATPKATERLALSYFWE